MIIIIQGRSDPILHNHFRIVQAEETLPKSF